MVEDECGVCGGLGIRYDLGHCDCHGNVRDCMNICGGKSVVDECFECGGHGI